ncbi:hypothetical protein [Sediminibacterium ginsengisoli]|uniref:Uncharacterized protein n=1 Tax=Sediminibacterium ginsengisoli TaxID=413434 RepID=A0A1T4R438_9BACT|nr:hypothetical protein [Sediminibacterium ginsengisoli]SKA10411.1 hypothetical protein SAMN04488132_110109 [Sediminibacterium ginsengisoli]
MPEIKNPTGNVSIDMWVHPIVSTGRKSWHEKNKRPAIEILSNGTLQPEYIMKWKVDKFLYFISSLISTPKKGLRIYIGQFGNSTSDPLTPKGMENQLTVVFSYTTCVDELDMNYKDDKKYYIITELNKRIVLVQNNDVANQRVKRYNDDCRKRLGQIFGNMPGENPAETKSVLHKHSHLQEIEKLIGAINADDALQPDVAFVWLRLTSYMANEPDADSIGYQKRLTVEFDLVDEDGNVIDILYDERSHGVLNNGGLCPPNTCYGNCLPEDDPEPGC